MSLQQQPSPTEDLTPLRLSSDKMAMQRSMVMFAMRAHRGAALISVMLNHDHTLVMEEEHLIAAASDCYDPYSIFAFLQT